MAACILCAAQITAENDSREHLIPNALGGRRKVSGFICRTCNSTAGETWDAELSRQLLPLSLMFDISRERGIPPPLKVVTTAGESLTIGPGGALTPSKPIFERAPNPGGGFRYRVSARSMDEARSILVGLKRKHPEIDIDAELSRAESSDTYAQGAVKHDLSIGGELAGRSIVKSCLAMAYASGIDWIHCKPAIEYLRGKAAPCFGYYHDTDLMRGRISDVPLHCLAVDTDSESGLIVAYAEYFGIHRVVACLGEDYAGPSLSAVYAFDPRDGGELKVDVEFPFSRSEIEDIYNYKHISQMAQQRTASAVIGPVIQARAAAEQKRIFDSAVEDAFKTCGAQPGETLTAEHMRKISQSIAAKVTPFLLRQRRLIG